MTTVVVAHGTRNRAGVAMLADLAETVSAALAEPVHVAFVDVLGPSPAEALTGLRNRPVTMIPAFLSAGHHVRVDVPAGLAESGHDDVVLTPALGPSPDLARAMLDRLISAGWRPGDSVVLAAAGTSDPVARGEIRVTATMLSALVGCRVAIAFAAPSRDGSGYRSVPETVARLRSGGAVRVAVASYLLAEGLFQTRLRDAGADVVAEPLGRHPAVIRRVCRLRRCAGPVASC